MYQVHKSGGLGSSLLAIAVATFFGSGAQAADLEPSPAVTTPTQLAVLSAAAAAAADLDTASETITVSGRRTDQGVLPDRPALSIYGTEVSVLDTPRVVSQVNAAQLLRDPLRTTDDFVKYAPGISRGGGQNVAGSPFIRGLTSEIFQNGQRIYKDGNDHPLNLNAFESADIVGGPSSVIFGPSNGTGGYVNYITKQPYFDKQRTEIRSSFGTWVPGGDSYSDFDLSVDTGGPISEALAYRVSIKGKRGSTYYKNVDNDYNSFYGAVAWRPRDGIRIDLNGSYDNYYNFNITRGWNRYTQETVDNFGSYWGGRATPILNSPGAGLWSPVFGSSDPTAAPIGWQTRTRNADGKFVAGAVQTTPLPNGTPETAGTIMGWVYDPSIPGNGLTRLSSTQAGGRPQDKNSAKRYISQFRVGIDLSPDWNLLSSTYFQRSINNNDSVGAFIYQNRSTLWDSRLEVRGKIVDEIFGIPVELQMNSGVSYRKLNYKALSANNSFNYNPIDLSLDPGTQTPGFLYGLPQADPNSSGSWIGTPGVPQLSPYFGYLKLPVMVPTKDGYYSEIGGFPTSGGAVYTSNGYIESISGFTQQNITFADRVGVNLGVNLTRIKAYINNPVIRNENDIRSDKGTYWLPSYQASLWVKPTANTTIYATYDRSTAVNTGVFGNFLIWGPGNKLNKLAFDSVSELYEGGIKADIIPGKLFASASGFVQYRDLSPDTFGNMAKVRIKGVESSLRFQASERFSAGLNGTYLKGVNTFIIPGGFSPFGFYADNETVWGDSNRLNQRPGGRYSLAGIPKYNLNGFVDYQFANGFGAQVDAWWTSSWVTNISQAVRIGSQHNVNVTLYYRTPKLDLSLRVLNVTDQNNFTNAGGGNLEFLQPLAPLAVQGQVAIRF
ncbi:MAG: TonB-dependent receptor [Novosphingobium sp.]